MVSTNGRFYVANRKPSCIPSEYGEIFTKRRIQNYTFFMDGKTYDVKIININNSVEKRKKDAYQIRYTRNGEFSQALQLCFKRSMDYIRAIRESRDTNDRRYIKVPEDAREYLAIYTTEYEDTFLVEPIIAEDIQIVKVRKLNRKIGENLKLLYGYRCQLCGRVIGEEYGLHIAEAHHIEYFVNSLNNDANNQMIVCPNHHSIIHDANPTFDRKRMMYLFSNGVEVRLVLNKHLV